MRRTTLAQRAQHPAVSLALLACVGLGLRTALLIHAGWRYDYDEGMVGLQVLRILRGARPVFHPGQPYLGALESYLLAPFFAVFGANAVTLKAIPLLLSGIYVASTGWVGWLAFDRQVGILSALLAAIAPTYLLVVGTKTWGATAETLVLGNLAMIATAIAVDARQPATSRRKALIALSFIGGVAFWVSWLISFYAIPIFIVLLWAGRSAWRHSRKASVLAFLAGSAPLWLYNIRHPFATFHFLLGDQGNTWSSLWDVLDHLTYDLAPRLVSGDPRWQILSWPAIWWLQLVYEGGLIALCFFAIASPWPAHRHPARVMLALFALGLPLIYVLSGYGNHALNAFGFDATGRYVLMIHSVMPIGVAAAGAWMLRRWRHARIVVAAIVTSVMALNLLGMIRLDPVAGFASPYYTRQPPTLRPLIEFLEQEDIRHVWTDVGIAHVLMFETHEQILAADWYDIYGAKGLVRFPEVPEEIYRAQRVAFVEVVLPNQQETPFERAFQEAGIAYEATRITPDLLVIIPNQPIDPALVDEGLGYQF